MLQLKNISKIYKIGGSEIFALNDISLNIEEGDFVAIMGPSGSGKSTLMNVLGLLDTPSCGNYIIQGKDVSSLSTDEAAKIRGEIVGFIFQQFNLLPKLTALENVSLPLLYSENNKNKSRAVELLEMVGLGDRLNHKITELSGGQQQRVAIARSLINNPTMIMADEPTGNLDSISEKAILDILKSLNQQGITIVMVTHEEEIGEQAARRIRFRDGKIVSDERLKSLPSKADSVKFKSVLSNHKPIATAVHKVKAYSVEAYRALWSNKVRSLLSMLGVLIGVSAVITMLGIGSGAQKQIKEQFSSLGSDLLVLRPGSTRVNGVMQEDQATRMSIEDVNALENSIKNILRASPLITGRGQVVYGNKNWNTEVQGVASSYFELHKQTLSEGRFFSDSENDSRTKIAIIGTTVAKELFGAESPIGHEIKINKTSFSVIGVMNKRGGLGWRDQDDIIMIPSQTAMYRMFGKSYVDSIEIEFKSGTDVQELEKDIIKLMRARHRVSEGTSDDESFRLTNMTELQDAVSASSQTLSLLLAIIAAVSLLVGGIGIMNVMLVSVTERTKEVGLRKAVGAKSYDILLQFLIESVAMTFVGGTIGITLGFLFTGFVAFVLKWSTEISVVSVFVSFFFSIIIGLIFGVYPAYRASSLDPIQALRSE